QHQCGAALGVPARFDVVRGVDPAALGVLPRSQLRRGARLRARPPARPSDQRPVGQAELLAQRLGHSLLASVARSRRFSAWIRMAGSAVSLRPRWCRAARRACGTTLAPKPPPPPAASPPNPPPPTT